MTRFVHRIDAIRILRIALTRARNPEETARIVAALSVLGSEAEATAQLESRADLVESLVRALKSLPDEDRGIVLSRVRDEGLAEWGPGMEPCSGGCGKWIPYQYCDECSKTAKCHHGNPLDCERCLVEGDLAHDAERESRS